jgi:hypothetical protein
MARQATVLFSACVNMCMRPCNESDCTQPVAVAKYGGVELDLPEFKHFEDNKKADFRAKFPGGKIPAFEGKNGFLLTETIAVTKYSECLESLASPYSVELLRRGLLHVLT